MTNPIYTPSELVRIELLRYDNPDGLHPIEEDWRNLSRKLLEHVELLQDILVLCKEKVPHYNLEGCRIKDWEPMTLPIKFAPKI